MFSRLFSLLRRFKGDVKEALHHETPVVPVGDHCSGTFGQGAQLMSAFATELELEANREREYQLAKQQEPDMVRRMEMVGVRNPEHYINKHPVTPGRYDGLTKQEVAKSRSYETLIGTPGTKSRFTGKEY